MDDESYVPLIQDDNKKSTSYKKYGAALGVAGITLAAALLLSGRSNAPVKSPSELDELQPVQLSLDQNTCMASFNRIWY